MDALVILCCCWAFRGLVFSSDSSEAMNRQRKQPSSVRQLLVYYRQDSSQQERVVYHVLPAPEEPKLRDAARGFVRPKTVRHDTAWKRIQNRLDDVARTYHRLLGLAVCDQPRATQDLLPAAAPLANLILPSNLFRQVLGANEQPVLVIEDRDVMGLPWEMFPRTLARCPTCQSFADVGTTARIGRFCSDCGGALEMAEGTLGTIWPLAFSVENSLVMPPCRNIGDRFLVVYDPTEDLAPYAQDGHDHLDAVSAELKKLGCEINVWKGGLARCATIMAELNKNDYAGFYFFGHGRTGPSGAGLALADGILWSGDILELQPTIPFVYLNACETAAVCPGFNGQQLSVSEAFLSGARSVVIAPTSEVCNLSASRAAEEFFALVAGLSDIEMGQALRQVRERSYARYRNGAADLIWAGMRYFGDPTQRYGLHDKLTDTPPRPVEAEPSAEVSQDLDPQSFPFEGFGVLFRAGKRCVSQGRDKITCYDLLAGLLRKGYLLRWACAQENVDPDGIYQQLLETAQPSEPSPNASQRGVDVLRERFRELAKNLRDGLEVQAATERFIDGILVTERQRFDGQAWNTLAKESHPDGAPSEFVVLKRLLPATGFAHSHLGLPETDVFLARLMLRGKMGWMTTDALISSSLNASRVGSSSTRTEWAGSAA